MRYAKIKSNDVVNGEGIIVSLYTQGCPHHCEGCFNEETWSFSGGMEFTDTQREEIFNAISKYGIQRNFSVLGGEPLCRQNVFEVFDICKDVKAMYPDTKIYVWTGYKYEQLLNMYSKDMLKYFDVLIDGRFEIGNRNLSLQLRGSTNQRVIDVKKSLKYDDIVLYTM